MQNRCEATTTDELSGRDSKALVQPSYFQRSGRWILAGGAPFLATSGRPLRLLSSTRC